MDAHLAEQTDQSPHRDLREPSRNGETVSNGSFVNNLLDSSVKLPSYQSFRALRDRAGT